MTYSELGHVNGWLEGAHVHAQLNLHELQISRHLHPCVPAAAHASSVTCMPAGSSLVQWLCACACLYSPGPLSLPPAGPTTAKIGDWWSRVIWKNRSTWSGEHAKIQILNGLYAETILLRAKRSSQWQETRQSKTPLYTCTFITGEGGNAEFS